MKRIVKVVVSVGITTSIAAIIASMIFRTFSANPAGFSIFGISPIISVGVMMFFLAFLVTASLGASLYILYFKPLRELNQIIESLSQGNMSVEIGSHLTKGDDEISNLAKSFNRTLSSLKLAMKREKTPLKIKRGIERTNLFNKDKKK